MSKLIIVPTPIGNLEDITLRAINTLDSVDIIMAEDTRKTKILLNKHNIKGNLRSHHKFNEHKTLQKVIDDLLSGKTIALVSDAGTPAISDPGYLLIRECLKNDIEIECLPGPTALIPALVNSGLPADRFFFEGFLPVKKGRKRKMEQIADLPYTMIFYESPFRLLKTLELFAQYFGDNRKAAVSREISKIHEETIRGYISELLEHFKLQPVKGEIVIVVEGKK